MSIEQTMVKIELVKQKRNKYEVFTSVDEKGIIFTEEEIVINRIIKGATFTKEKWEEIKNKHEQSLLYEKALKYISYKPRTIQEVTNHLKELSDDLDIINEIIEKLIKLDFLNDTRYAYSYLESSIRTGNGPIKISHELHNKGIEEKIIKEVLLTYTTEQQIEVAYNVSIKHLKLLDKYPMRKQKELLSQKLLRSGFNYSIINQVIPLMSFNSDNMEQLEKDYEKISKKTNDKNKIIQHLLQKGYEYSDIKKILNTTIYEE